MKKILTLLFMTVGTVLFSGCSFTGKNLVDDSSLNENNTVLQQQTDEFSIQIENLKNENEKLLEENNILKATAEKNSNENIDSGDIKNVKNWQNYQNLKYGFQISYPQSRVYNEFDYGIGFGLPDIGDSQWGVNFYASNELENIIAQMGNQFKDRKESRIEVEVNENITGTMVTVTTNEYLDWIGRTVYIENNGQLFAIGNGVVDNDGFTTFYKSFKFIK